MGIIWNIWHIFDRIIFFEVEVYQIMYIYVYIYIYIHRCFPEKQIVFYNVTNVECSFMNLNIYHAKYWFCLWQNNQMHFQNVKLVGKFSITHRSNDNMMMSIKRMNVEKLFNGCAYIHHTLSLDNAIDAMNMLTQKQTQKARHVLQLQFLE